LRPKENCPCYNMFAKKGMKELKKLYVKALKNQMRELMGFKHCDKRLLKKLK